MEQRKNDGIKTEQLQFVEEEKMRWHIKVFREIKIDPIQYLSCIQPFRYYPVNKDKLIFCTFTLSKSKMLIREYLILFKICETLADAP